MQLDNQSLISHHLNQSHLNVFVGKVPYIVDVTFLLFLFSFPTLSSYQHHCHHHPLHQLDPHIYISASVSSDKNLLRLSSARSSLFGRMPCSVQIEYSLRTQASWSCAEARQHAQNGLQVRVDVDASVCGQLGGSLGQYFWPVSSLAL